MQENEWMFFSEHSVHGKVYSSCVSYIGWNVACEKGMRTSFGCCGDEMWVCQIDRYSIAALRRSLDLEEDIVSVLWWNTLRWYGHVLRKDEGDWDYEMEGARHSGRPKKTWEKLLIVN